MLATNEMDTKLTNVNVSGSTELMFCFTESNLLKYILEIIDQINC